MVDNTIMNKKQQNNLSLDNKKQAKKKYVKPELSSLGDIRDVTMGGSPGTGDSGNAGTQLPF